MSLDDIEALTFDTGGTILDWHSGFSAALARALAQTKLHGSVAAVGLAGGATLETSVLPFLVRGVSLLGIDSATCPGPRRRQAWARLASELPLDKLDAMTSEAVLADLPDLANKILKGQVRGRLVVDVNG